MLSQDTIKELTKKFQTVEKNVVREYFQHLFLSSLYKLPETEKLLFKGGTALRIIYGSPRFSEDLDFTGKDIHDLQTIDTLFINVLSNIADQGIKVDLKEAKPTTGGYLGIIHYELYDFIEDMKFEISLRNGRELPKEVSTIVNDYAPAYTIVSLSGEEIIRGKIAALISRKKPRDYYDIYFLLRHHQLHQLVEKNKLTQVLRNLEKEELNFRNELSVLLPVSHQLILRDFKKNLIQEIKRYL